MLQLSKIKKSRDEWKEKAKKKTKELWEMRKVLKYYQKRVADLVKENKRLRTELKELKEKEIKSNEKKNDSSIGKQEIRILLVYLIIVGVISYRSSTRVLEIFQEKTSLEIDWIPHFTSVINCIPYKFQGKF